MIKVIGVRFRTAGKVYFFDPLEYDIKRGDHVIVETARGVEYGKTVMLPTDVEEDRIVAPLKPIMRIATEEDEKLYQKLEEKRPEAFKIASEKIEKSGLNMKLVDVEYTFDQTKLIIYFTADSRVDFRELVKELAAAFHIRIELRQIGARDECKMLGGLGPCGRACCCSDHMSEYARVSIKMAKNQNLSLNPTKISGLCGRLMCCLSYENSFYAEVNKKMPKMDSEIVLNDGRKGIVCAINQLKESVNVKINDNDNIIMLEVPLKDIKFKGKGSAMDDIVVDGLEDDLKSLEEN